MSDLIKVSLQGTMPGGEVFSVNPVFKLTTGSEIRYEEATMAVAAINALTIPSAILNMITTGCAWTGCRVEGRTVTGELEVLAEGTRTTPATGTGPSEKPFQTSMVLSLRTPTPGGRGRGRLYWPATGVGISATTLRVAGANVSTYLAAIKTYLTAVEGAIDGVIDETVELAVWSRTAAQLPLVNSMSMGDILDTQRRRRDAVPEGYTSVSWP